MCGYAIVVALVAGFLLGLYFRRDSLTFKERCRREFKTLTTYYHIEIVLADLKDELAAAYAHRRECETRRSNPHQSETDGEIPADEMQRIVTAAHDKVRAAHASYDYARGLAYLCGQGGIADRVNRSTS